MKNTQSIDKIVHNVGNIIGVWIIAIILLIAFYFQFALHDLPCPLCLLQRVAFVAVGVALCMNVRFGAKPAHYGMALLAAIVGIGIAMRQVFLHIHPNDPGYGSPLWGAHFYSWAALCFFIIMIVIGIGLHFAFANKDNADNDKTCNSQTFCWIKKVTLWVFAIFILANLLSTFAECGFGQCPDNPVLYWLFN